MYKFTKLLEQSSLFNKRNLLIILLLFFNPFILLSCKNNTFTENNINLQKKFSKIDIFSVNNIKKTKEEVIKGVWKTYTKEEIQKEWKIEYENKITCKGKYKNYNKNNNNIVNFGTPTELLSRYRINKIIQSPIKKKTIWVLSSYCYELDLSNGKWKKLTYIFGKYDDSITSQIQKDTYNKDIIWIDSKEGIIRYSIYNKKFKIFPEINGFIKIIPDKYYVWFVSDFSIFKYNRKTKQMLKISNLGDRWITSCELWGKYLLINGDKILNTHAGKIIEYNIDSINFDISKYEHFLKRLNNFTLFYNIDDNQYIINFSTGKVYKFKGIRFFDVYLIKNKLWFFNTNGVGEINIDTNGEKFYKIGKQVYCNPIFDGEIFFLLTDIGTVEFDPSTKEIFVYRDKFLPKFITKNNIWVDTPNGLIMIKKSYLEKNKINPNEIDNIKRENLMKEYFKYPFGICKEDHIYGYADEVKIYSKPDLSSKILGTFTWGDTITYYMKMPPEYIYTTDGYIPYIENKIFCKIQYKSKVAWVNIRKTADMISYSKSKKGNYVIFYKMRIGEVNSFPIESFLITKDKKTSIRLNELKEDVAWSNDDTYFIYTINANLMKLYNLKTNKISKITKGHFVIISDYNEALGRFITIMNDNKTIVFFQDDGINNKEVNLKLCSIKIDGSDFKIIKIFELETFALDKIKILSNKYYEFSVGKFTNDKTNRYDVYRYKISFDGKYTEKKFISREQGF